ncbi:MAG: hypothetical protein HYZ29_31325 [Myxococcales bacterium]|nr:hypothetical protein [Myxococcales bacterium]
MRRSLSCLAVLAAASSAAGQAAPPRAPGAAPAAATKHGDATDDLDDDDVAPPAKVAAPSKAEPDRGAKPKALPPPVVPRADEQEPRPVFGAGATEAERHLEIGPDFGIWSRPAKGETVEYAPGFAWGAHVRAELLPFLGLRAYFDNSTHAVDVPRGALGLDGTQIEQPDLQVFQLGARLEPTFMPAPTLRLWAGVGVAWARATAPAPSSTGAMQIRHADRSGVFLEYSGALGATWDFVPRWLAATLSVSGGLLTDPSGDLFDEAPVNDGAGGTAKMGGLPEFSASYVAQLGVGLIL